MIPASMLLLRAYADRDDRLAERDDHDRAVALGEMTGDELPAVGPEEVRTARVEHQRETPQSEPKRTIGERCRQDQAGADRRAAGQPDNRLAQRGILAAGEHEQQDVRDADHPVGECEGERVDPNAPGTQSAAIRKAAIARNMTSLTSPSSGSTTLVSQA